MSIFQDAGSTAIFLSGFDPLQTSAHRHPISCRPSYDRGAYDSLQSGLDRRSSIEERQTLSNKRPASEAFGSANSPPPPSPSIHPVHAYSSYAPRVTSLSQWRPSNAPKSAQAHNASYAPRIFQELASASLVKPLHAGSWLCLPPSRLNSACGTQLSSQEYTPGSAALHYHEISQGTFKAPSAHRKVSSLPENGPGQTRQTTTGTTDQIQSRKHMSSVITAIGKSMNPPRSSSLPLRRSQPDQEEPSQSTTTTTTTITYAGPPLFQEKQKPPPDQFTSPRRPPPLLNPHQGRSNSVSSSSSTTAPTTIFKLFPSPTSPTSSTASSTSTAHDQTPCFYPEFAPGKIIDGDGEEEKLVSCFEDYDDQEEDGFGRGGGVFAAIRKRLRIWEVSSSSFSASGFDGSCDGGDGGGVRRERGRVSGGFGDQEKIAALRGKDGRVKGGGNLKRRRRGIFACFGRFSTS